MSSSTSLKPSEHKSRAAGTSRSHSMDHQKESSSDTNLHIPKESFQTVSGADVSMGSPATIPENAQATQRVSGREHGKKNQMRTPSGGPNPSLIKDIIHGSMEMARGLWAGSAEPQPSPSKTVQRRQERSAHDKEAVETIPKEQDVVVEDFSKTYEARLNNVSLQLSAAEQAKHQWHNYAERLRKDIEELRAERDETTHILQKKLHKLEGEKDSFRIKYETLVQQQQEQSFRQMESGRWVPDEESKVVHELESLKRGMRAWAKNVALKDMSQMGTLGKEDSSALMQALSAVVAMKGSQLPPGLPATKSPALLLMALLAHFLFTSVFREPFFFLGTGSGSDAEPNPAQEILTKIYQLAYRANPRDAQLWRSQTLRMLLPPLASDTTIGGKEFRQQTESMISHASQQQCEDFLASPARHFVQPDVGINHVNAVKSLFQTAASLSYRLWTRKTAMRCSTLQDLTRVTFDIEDPRLVPHTLVQYEKAEGQLKGRPITLMVHPLLEVCGTDEGQDYDITRVWACAEVWLESK